MASYRTTLNTSTAPAEAFDYVARFSSAAQWDPSAVGAKDLTGGPVVLGSAFEVTVRVLGRDLPLRYEVIEIDRPRRVVVRAESGSFVSEDTIAVRPSGSGSELTYNADLRPKGWLVLFSPVLSRSFRRTCERAAEGLQRELDRVSAR